MFPRTTLDQNRVFSIPAPLNDSDFFTLTRTLFHYSAVYWFLMVPDEKERLNMQKFRSFTRTFEIPNTARINLLWDGAAWHISGPLTDHLPRELVTL
jgi:hypothetical protein